MLLILCISKIKRFSKAYLCNISREKKWRITFWRNATKLFTLFSQISTNVFMLTHLTERVLLIAFYIYVNMQCKKFLGIYQYIDWGFTMNYDKYNAICCKRCFYLLICNGLSCIDQGNWLQIYIEIWLLQDCDYIHCICYYY